MAEIKTGEVNWLDYAGNLWWAQTFEDEDTHWVHTTQTLLEAVDPENPPSEPVPFPPPEDPPPEG